MFKNLLWHLLVGTRGGSTRTSIISAILARPANMHQLAKRLSLDYKTIQYHVRLLEENNILSAINKDTYGATYFPSSSLEAEMEVFQQIRNAYGKDLGKDSKRHRR